MPRKNTNKTFYNYSIKKFDKFGEIENISFFMTHYEIMEKYNVSCPTIYRHLKTEVPIRKLKNLKIERVKVPVYKKVINDVFSHNYIDTDSEDSNTEVELIEKKPDGSQTIHYTFN